MTRSPGSRREAELLTAVVSLVDNLLHDFDVVELLTQLSEQCVQLLDVASAGLLLVDPGHRLNLMAATTEPTRHLELFQLQADEGPCLDCFSTGQSVSVADLRQARGRWPQFTRAATEAGFVSVHAIPMHAAGLVLGTLGLFGTSVGELNADDLVVGQTLAHIATVAIVQEQGPTPGGVLPKLRTALASRIVVEQAKGFLRARLDISVEDAFRLLRRYSTVHGRKLTEVARTLLTERAARPEIMDGLTRLAAELP